MPGPVSEAMKGEERRGPGFLDDLRVHWQQSPSSAFHLPSPLALSHMVSVDVDRMGIDRWVLSRDFADDRSLSLVPRGPALAYSSSHHELFEHHAVNSVTRGCSEKEESQAERDTGCHF